MPRDILNAIPVVPPPRRRTGKARKLTSEKVAEMRSLYAAGNVSQTELAVRFGVSPGLVSDIVLGKRWRDVA